MLMTNDNIRLFPHDRFMAKTLLRIIPKWISPNAVTYLRFLLTPVVLFFLWREMWSIVLPLFIATAFTDAIDGSLARTRKQITLWGTTADPIADKFLIGSVVILFVAQQVNPAFAAIILFVEVLIVLSAIYRRSRGKISSANEFGKIKMILQVVGVSLLMLARLYSLELAVPFAVGTLAVAVVFAIVSLVTYSL